MAHTAYPAPAFTIDKLFATLPDGTTFSSCYSQIPDESVHLAYYTGYTDIYFHVTIHIVIAHTTTHTYISIWSTIGDTFQPRSGMRFTLTNRIGPRSLEERIMDARLPDAFYESVVLFCPSQETPG